MIKNIFLTLSSKSPLKSKKGFTLIELIISISILTMVSLSINFLFLSSEISKTKKQSVRHLAIVHITENLIKNIGHYQFYVTQTEIDLLTGADLQQAYDKFPWALDKDGVVSVDDCSDCLRRMGAVVTKEPDYPGLYTVTLRGIEKKQDNSYGEFYVKTHLISPSKR